MRVDWTRCLISAAMLALLALAPAFAQDAGAFTPEDAVAAAVAVVRPSVVTIETRFDEPRIDDTYAYWMYSRGPRPLYGLWGTGFIYKDPQYVVTAKFLLEHAKYVRIILDDGRSYSAEKVGDNEDFGFAVLKVDWGPDLEPISPAFAKSEELKLGQPIAIVGKALNSVDTFATAGIISAIRKQIPDSEKRTDKFLQFDASYELSFIGSPIVNVMGGVVGMVQGTAGTGINLGVPIDEIVTIADKIIAGKVTETWFGVEPLFVTTGIKESGFAPKTFDWAGDGKAENVDFGMWVSYVAENSPADIAGLQVGDLIAELDSTFLKDEYAWYAFTRDFEVGQLVLVKFLRKNELTGKWEKQETQVQIIEKPKAEEKKTAAPDVAPLAHPDY